jgi:hypothetical protein
MDRLSIISYGKRRKVTCNCRSAFSRYTGKSFFSSTSLKFVNAEFIITAYCR